jgi:hypothetical protein
LDSEGDSTLGSRDGTGGGAGEEPQLWDADDGTEVQGCCGRVSRWRAAMSAVLAVVVVKVVVVKVQLR